MNRHRTWSIAAGVLFLLECLWFRRFTIDDAFISYRTAFNWAQGWGPVMNLGERVEGVSNLPWTAWLAAGAALGVAPHHLAPWCGIACGLLTVLLTGWLAQRWGGDSGAGQVALVWMATCAPVAVWSVSGLETLGYAALVTGVFLLGTRTDRSLPSLRFGLLLACVAAMRPEGILLTVVWIVFALRQPLPRASLGRTALGFLALALPLLLWRQVTYGQWIANPVLAKASFTTARLGPGLMYLGKVAVFSLPLLAWIRSGFVRLDRARQVLVAGWIVVQAVFMLAVGGERFPGYRFLVPVLPVLVAVSACAFGPKAGKRPNANRSATERGASEAALKPGRWILGLVGGVALLVLVRPGLVLGLLEGLSSLLRLQAGPEAHQGRLLGEARMLAAALLAVVAIRTLRSRWPLLAAGAVVVWFLVAVGIDPSLRPCRFPGPAAWHGRIVGEWLRHNAPSDVVVATNAAGALPYFSRLRVIDMLGLTDAHIARVSPDRQQWIGHEKGDGAYVLGRHPDVIIFGGPEGSATPWSFVGDQQIAASDAFVRDYELQRVVLPQFTFTYWRARAGRMPQIPTGATHTPDS